MGEPHHIGVSTAHMLRFPWLFPMKSLTSTSSSKSPAEIAPLSEEDLEIQAAQVPGVPPFPPGSREKTVNRMVNPPMGTSTALSQDGEKKGPQKSMAKKKGDCNYIT